MTKIKQIIDYIRRVREKSINFNRSGLYITFALISVYALVMSVVCFLKADMVMGFVNVATAAIMTLIILIFAKIKSGRMLSVFVVVFIYVLMFFFLYEGGVGGVSILWLLFVPMAGMSLISLYYGGILSLLLGITIPLYMLTPLNQYGYQYSEDYRIRFPIIYWASFIMALIIFIRVDKSEEMQKKLIVKADDSNRMKSEFLANMSHEIRTPMNAIMGMCELTMKEDISENVRENNENIYTSSKSLMGIINDLLDFSKIESGRMELSCSQYRLSDVLNDVVYMIDVRKGNKKIEYVVDCDPDIPDLLYGDEVRIRQIMINILTNAVKYTQTGALLLKLTFRREAYGINLIISVKDSGIGIKKENIKRIFDPYGRVDAEKTRKIEGTGLGLPITKKLVKLMNGMITVKSEYGKGTEFKVVIPQKVVSEEPIVSIENPASIKILSFYSVDSIPQFAAESYSLTLKNILNKFAIPRYLCSSLEEAKKEIATDTYTHVIIGQTEYLEDMSYFDELSKIISVTVVQNRTTKLPLGGNITNAYKPFYTRKFSDILNNSSRSKERLAPDVFTIPDANILFVDDNMVNLRVALGHMKAYRAQVDTASSGMQAIEMIKQKKYDVVFMDHLMPGMDGIETHREIRLIQKDYAKKIPVIALTANVASDAKDLFITEGFQDFMSKPILSNVLKEMLLKWVPDELIIAKRGDLQ